MQFRAVSKIAPHKEQQLETLISNAIDNAIIPGIEVLLFQNTNVLFHRAYGYKRIKPDIEYLTLNSIFDIASITKIVSTTPLIMILLEQGMITLNTPILNFFSEYQTASKSKITLFHLLTHTSGLPAWVNLYENHNTPEEAYKKLLSLPLEYEPGTKMIYSCMGFITLKLIIEKITGRSLDDLTHEYILKPLEMQDSYFNPDKKLLDNIVPTGECNWRNKIVHGEVHDENCYFLGGTAGNAGLFSTARDLHRFAVFLLNNGYYKKKKILSQPSIHLMLNNQLPNNLSPRGIGFQLKDSENRPSGETFTTQSAGHLGFTGTSFWIDPVTKYGIILLSNRVHLTYKDNIDAMKPFRMKIQNILLSSVL